MRHALPALVLALLAAPAAAQRGSGIDFHGFVQATWQGNYTARANEFRVDEIQLDVGRRWSETAALFLRLNYRHIDVFDTQGTAKTPDYHNFVEQAWVSLDVLQKSHGLTFTFGKLRIPMGYESINVTDAYQYSRSYTFEVGAPQLGTGAMVRWRRGMFDVAAYAVNGWNTITDNNDAKMFGGRLGFSLLDGDLTFGVSYAASPEPIPNRPYTNVRSPRHTLDFDVLYSPVRDLTIGAELNYGYEDRASQVNLDRRARWLSVLGTVHYKLRPWLATTLRYEHVDDPDASRLYALPHQWVASPTPGQWGGVPLTIESLTVAALFTIAPWAKAVVEWRNDWIARGEDRPVFPAERGALTKARRLFAVSMYYSW